MSDNNIHADLTAEAVDLAVAAVNSSAPASLHTFPDPHIYSDNQIMCDSKEEALEYLNAYSKRHNIGIVTSKSDQKRQVFIYTCDRGSSYRSSRKIPDNHRKKPIRTRRINCPFKISLRRGKMDPDTHMYPWKLQTHEAGHNHDATIEGKPSSVLRKRSEIDILLIEKLYNLGVKPQQIVQHVREKGTNPNIDIKDVYNDISAMKRKKGRSKKNIKSGETPDSATVRSTVDSILKNHESLLAQFRKQQFLAHEAQHAELQELAAAATAHVKPEELAASAIATNNPPAILPTRTDAVDPELAIEK